MHIYTHTYIHTLIHAFIYIGVFVLTAIPQMHAHVHTCIRAYDEHTLIHTGSLVMQPYITNTCTRRYMHTYILTYIHTYSISCRAAIHYK